jgi:hypothetical protein
MKKLFTIALLLACALSLNAQDEFKPGGSGIGVVFFNYRYDLTQDVNRTSSFNLERAYLGYKYDFAKNLSGRVIFDIAYDNTTKAFTAYAKNAYMEWAVLPELKLSFGMIPLKHFDLQDKFWGYRYIMKTYTDEYGMGTTADLGLSAELPLNDFIAFNIYAVNGEGFRGIQDNFGVHKYGANATIKPAAGFIARLHYDMVTNKYQRIDTVNNSPVVTILDSPTISVLSAFVGYEQKDLFRVGVEYNFMNNATGYRAPAEDHTSGGISVFGTYIFNPKFEIFARYDYLNKEMPLPYGPPQQPIERWDYKKGSLIMGGVQYKPVKNVNLSLNYRTFIYEVEIDGQPNTSGLYVNLGLFL